MTGWVLVGAAMVYETYALVRGAETMSAAFRRITKHPVGRVAALAGWTALTVHLFQGER